MTTVIDSFTGKYRFLSNFYSSPFHTDLIVPDVLVMCPTVEHGFQAMKSADYRERLKILALPTASDAKRAGRKLKLRADWEDVRLEVMESLVREKFFQNPLLAKALLKTEGAELVEGNHWGDVFWGVCRGAGRNELGKILMRVREKLRGPTV